MAARGGGETTAVLSTGVKNVVLFVFAGAVQCILIKWEVKNR